MISFVDEILYDYLDKVITKKQVYEYLSSYGYSKKQIKIQQTFCLMIAKRGNNEKLFSKIQMYNG